MEQKTLIALYGEKQVALTTYLVMLRDLITDRYPEDLVRPYETGQVHATVIGLEALQRAHGIINRNTWEQEGREVRMNLSGLKTVVNRFLPLHIRFGGFSPGDKPFLSRGEEPYRRSFRIDIPNRRIILMGWPHHGGDFGTPQLANLRETLRLECGIAPKYPRDNDFYMVLAELVTENNEAFIADLLGLQSELQDYLATHPLDIEVGVGDICMARYSDPRLPRNTTEIISL